MVYPDRVDVEEIVSIQVDPETMPVHAPPEELLGGLNEQERRYSPEILHCAGDTTLLRYIPRISVIGSRRASPEDLELACRITRCVVDHGGIVVSGLATGVDTVAHRTAIEAGGRTIAVIATPLDRATPAANAPLQRLIAERHLVVSQFGPGHPVRKGNFVLRNRTMALLSHGSIIVTAGEKSGTQHQGWEAIRLGRVLLLHASLLDQPFDWPRKMEEYGAIVFETIDHLRWLLDEYLPAIKGGEPREVLP